MATNPLPSDAPTPGVHRLLDAPVRKVTLLEDRAQVGREGTLQLPAGSHRIKIASVSPVIADRSVVARAGDGLRVDEARVVRWWRIGSEERPGDAKELSAEIAKLISTLRHKQELQSLLEGRRAMVEQAADLLIEGINRELPFAKTFQTSWPMDLESFLDAVRGLDESILESNFELRDLHAKLVALDLRLRTFGRVDHVLASDLEVEVTVEKAGQHTITVEYMVPCALWRPIHRATLLAGAGADATKGTMKLECEGAVWQATGEDWKDVALSFSTARSTQRSEPPVVYDDLLHAQRRADKKTDVSVREQNIATTGETQTEKSSDLPGVDDGGETRLLGAATRATVLSDGRLYRVPVFSFDAPAEIDLIARPERTTLVHRRSKQVNAAKHPVLAGPVELLRESGYVGRGTIDFIAPGEKFAFGWGAEDGLRVKRTVHEKRETAKLTGKQTVLRTVELFLSNLDDKAATLRLEERIPVSEIENVTILLDERETSPLAKADDQGIVGWAITLPPHGSQKVKLVYRLVASSDVRGL